MGASLSSEDGDRDGEFQSGGAGAEELAEIDAKAVSTVGGARRRAGGRAKTHKAPAGRRNKTRKSK